MLRIRPFKKGVDEETYVLIFNAAFGDYDDIRAMTLEEMRKMEESPSFSAEGVFLAEWNDQPAGMVDAYVDKLRKDEKGFIQSLGVLPQYRGKGIARELVETALESHRDRGVKIVDAWAQSDRAACVHIFESFGFKPVRVTRMMKRSLDRLPFDVKKRTESDIREMQLQNDEEIVLLNKLDNESFKEHFNYRPRTIDETRYALFEMPWFQQQHVFFADMENVTVSYVIIGIDEGLNAEKCVKYGWILDIGVLKPFRRRGIGTELMLHGMSALKALGMEHALLYVDEMNVTKAMLLYEKLEFETVRKNLIYRLQIA